MPARRANTRASYRTGYREFVSGARGPPPAARRSRLARHRRGSRDRRLGRPAHRLNDLLARVQFEVVVIGASHRDEPLRRPGGVEQTLDSARTARRGPDRRLTTAIGHVSAPMRERESKRSQSRRRTGRYQ
ncbi:MAG: hypothetical protein MZV64_73235 [Ignavibacteriales bacterium]|nr:hypothetical protein [Ignavibacteriales bacterium]